jgi:hypothetical protein
MCKLPSASVLIGQDAVIVNRIAVNAKRVKELVMIGICWQ